MKNIIRILMICCALTTHFALSGCGSGGSGGAQNAAVTYPPANSPAESAGNSYTLDVDTYGLQQATFMSAANDSGGVVLQAAIAESMTDPGFTSVFRIDITPARINGPGNYQVGGDNNSNLPVVIKFANGHVSTWLYTTSGTITFTSYGTHTSDVVAGSFSVQVEDLNSSQVPRPVYQVNATFRFVVGNSGLLVPAQSPVPAEASGLFNANCASCHTLGIYGSVTDLALKGGEINGIFTADVPGHKHITLTATEISDLKILLNSK